MAPGAACAPNEKSIVSQAHITLASKSSQAIRAMLDPATAGFTRRFCSSGRAAVPGAMSRRGRCTMERIDRLLGHAIVFVLVGTFVYATAVSMFLGR